MGADSRHHAQDGGDPGLRRRRRSPPGEYILKAKKVSDTDWVLKLEKPEGNAAAEVPLQASALDKSVEDFTIDLSEEKGQGVFRMSWGTLALATRFTAK